MFNISRRLPTRRARFFLILSASIALFQTATLIYASTNDASVDNPPAYTTFQPPSAGGSYTDPVFGTAIKRITNSMTMTRADNGGTLTTVAPEYSTMSPFNMDNTRLLLQHFSYFGLYDGSGNFLKNVPLDVNASTEPRWSRSDPNVFYYVRGNQLKQYNAGTDNISIVATFGEYSSISGMGESDISFDGTRMVFAGNKRYVFVYNLSNGTKGPAFDTGGRSFDSLYITPNNNVTITWNSSGTGRYQGIELFDGNMNFLRQIAHAGGHMDVTRDTNGDEVAVWMNAADPTPICDNGIIKVRLADAHQTCLVSLDWSLAVHISAPDNAGFAMVETYAPGDPLPPNGWVRYTDEFLQVKLDGSEVRRIAHHRSRPLNSYTYMPKVSVSRDGSKLVFGSNFGLQKILGYPAEYSDAYMIDLGAPSTNTNSNNGTAPSSGTPSAPSGGGGTTTPPTTSTPAEPAPIPAPAPAPSPATATVTRYEQTSAAFSGSWYDNGLASHSGSSAKLAVEQGSRAAFPFTGTGVSWIAYRDEWSGIANVYIDGTLQGQVDTYAAASHSQASVYTVGGLANREHLLTIEVTGKANPAAGGAWIWVDAFDVASGASAANVSSPSPAAPAPVPAPTPAPAPAPVQAPHPPPPVPVGVLSRIDDDGGAIQFSNGWYNNNLAAHSGGTAKLSMEPGAKASFTYTGTDCSWISYRDEWSGIANVYIDGVLQGQVDTYASPTQAHAPVYTKSGLPWGTHTLTIEATGMHSAPSAGSWIWVDAVDYVGTR